MAASRTTEQLIAQILSNPRLKESAHFSSAVYQDEPILKTAAQMDSYLPEKYREMRQIAQDLGAWTGSYGTGGASRSSGGRPSWAQRMHAERGANLLESGLDPQAGRIFVAQARFMADWEDDCPYHGTFERYFPTYQQMNDRQLRGYFTWRTHLRAGTVEKAPLSFAFTHLYELVNSVGSQTPAEGFEKLRSFWLAYRDLAPEIDRYARRWMRDYVVYHGLDRTLLAASADQAHDAALAVAARAQAAVVGSRRLDIGTGAARLPQVVLPSQRFGLQQPAEAPDPMPAADTRHAASSAPGTEPVAGKRKRRREAPYDFAHPPFDEAELFSALASLSSYRIENGRLYKEEPDDVRRVCAAVFCRLARYYRSNRKSDLVESLFGERATLPYPMFASAVFYEEEPHAETTYELSAVETYFCTRGRWWCKRFQGARSTSTQLGKILRAIDQRLRDAEAFSAPLKEASVPKYLAHMIDQEIARYLPWKKAHASRRISIDRSQLGQIRAAAALTQEALLVDEERGEQAPVRTEADLGHAPAPLQPGKACARVVPQAASPSATRSTQPARSAEEAPPPAAQKPARGHAPQEPAHDTPRAAQPSFSPIGPFTPAAPAASGVPDGLNLTAAETELLEALLAGADPSGALAQTGALPSVAVDCLNEKLFDVVGDAVIEFDGTVPVLVEDYHEDIEDLLRGASAL